MSIVDALKRKGSTGGRNIEEAIRNLPEGGGDGLPEVTSDDNGSVLMVVEGEWAGAKISSNMEVNAIFDNSDPYSQSMSLDKTYKEIRDAIINKINVNVLFDFEAAQRVTHVRVPVLGIMALPPNGYVIFVANCNDLLPKIFTTNDVNGYPVGQVPEG